jgi:rhodanese-related sulfurtransferase
VKAWVNRSRVNTRPNHLFAPDPDGFFVSTDSLVGVQTVADALHLVRLSVEQRYARVDLRIAYLRNFNSFGRPDKWADPAGEEVLVLDVREIYRSYDLWDVAAAAALVTVRPVRDRSGLRFTGWDPLVWRYMVRLTPAELETDPDTLVEWVRAKAALREMCT